MDPNRTAIAVLQAARRWLKTRRVLKRLLDSKSASKDQVQKAKKVYDKACTDLEAATARFENMLNAGGGASMAKGSGGRPFPWRNFVGMVAEVAKAAETAIGAAEGKTPDVIDTTGEPVE